MGEPLVPVTGDHVWKGALRYYKIGDRAHYPGVTTILGATKPAHAAKALQKWIDRVGEAEAHAVKERAAFRGSGMHDAVESFLKGEPISVIPESAPYWQSVQSFFPKIQKVYLVEGVLYHPSGYAGKVDMIAHIDFPGIIGGVPAIVDWKTADKEKDEGWVDDYRNQVAGYAAGANRVYNKPYGGIRHGVIVIAIPEKPAQIIWMGPTMMMLYWKQFQGRVKRFHELMKEGGISR